MLKTVGGDTVLVKIENQGQIWTYFDLQPYDYVIYLKI